MLKLKLGRLEISWGGRCARQRCYYYTHYLSPFSPNMSHAAFHKAEKECLRLQDFLLSQLDRFRVVAPELQEEVEKLEEMIRA